MAKKKPVVIPAGVPDEMAAFLRSLAEKPKDRTTRLVFADWLDERSDPRSAWLRDETMWNSVQLHLVHWFTLDPRGLIPALLEELDPTRSGNPSYYLVTPLLAALGPPAVAATREWVRAANTFQRWDVSEGFLLGHPPPELRPVKALIKELEGENWYDCWEAITDLGFHGPAAAPAVKALEKVSRRYWDELEEQMDRDPIERAAYRALGAIGPAAHAAIPLLASAVHYADEATDALLALGADPDLVAKHICADEDKFAGRGVSVVWQLDSQGTGAMVRLLTDYGRKGEAAAETLGWMGEKAAGAVPALIAALEGLKGHWNRHYMTEVFAKALANIGKPAKAALPVLQAAFAEYAKDDMHDRYVRNALTAAIAKLEAATAKPRRKKKR